MIRLNNMVLSQKHGDLIKTENDFFTMTHNVFRKEVQN